MPFPQHRLAIEITKSAVVQRFHDAKAVLKALRNVGVRVALDDFGTGYSGLHRLRELDLDTLKIDRSFISQMLTKPEEERVVKAMLNLGRALGLKTTAEGIETEQALEQLRKLGCDTGQDYLFDKPQPAAAVEAMVGEEVRGAAKLRKEGTRPRRIA